MLHPATQSLLILIVALAAFLLRLARGHPGGLFGVFAAFASTCAVTPPGAYRSGPFPASSLWCGSGSELAMITNHMRVNCAGMDACIAAEFGTLVAVGFVPSVDLFLINPTLLPPASGAEMIACQTAQGIRRRHSPAAVTHGENRTTSSLANRGACAVHLIVEALAGT